MRFYLYRLDADGWFAPTCRKGGSVPLSPPATAHLPLPTPLPRLYRAAPFLLLPPPAAAVTVPTRLTLACLLGGAPYSAHSGVFAVCCVLHTALHLWMPTTRRFWKRDACCGTAAAGSDSTLILLSGRGCLDMRGVNRRWLTLPERRVLYAMHSICLHGGRSTFLLRTPAPGTPSHTHPTPLLPVANGTVSVRRWFWPALLPHHRTALRLPHHGTCLWLTLTTRIRYLNVHLFLFSQQCSEQAYSSCGIFCLVSVCCLYGLLLAVCGLVITLRLCGLVCGLLLSSVGMYCKTAQIFIAPSC